MVGYCTPCRAGVCTWLSRTLDQHVSHLQKALKYLLQYFFPGCLDKVGCVGEEMGEGVISTHNPQGQSWTLKPPWWPVQSYFWALKGSSAVSDTCRLLGPLCSVQKESGITSRAPWAKGLNQVAGIWFRNQEWVGEDPISWRECVRGKPAETSSGYFLK